MRVVGNNLRKAKALIEHGWTQHQYARTAKKRAVRPLSKSAVCFCALGAIQRATGREGDFGPEVNALETIVTSREHPDVPDWNDAEGRTQAEVLAAFDAAIKLADGG